MLWQRVLTALVLVPLVVAGILLLDSAVLAAILAAAILIGGREMARLAGLRSVVPQLVYIGVLAVALWLAWQYVRGELLFAAQWILSAWWIMMTLALLARRRDLAVVEGSRPAILLLGGIVLISAWASIVNLHMRPASGPVLVLFLFVLIWVADSGAYFAGRAFGKTKLSPFVSPGKTWAGAGGAVLGAVLAGAVLALSGWAGALALLATVALSVLVTLVSIGGDLWESRLKREAGVKDSGNLLPGHGGMLDRIDSLLAAAPVFALGIGLIGGGA